MPPEAMLAKIREMEARDAAQKAAEDDVFNAFATADLALIALARIEREHTNDTRMADIVSRELVRIVRIASEMENKLAAIREVAS
jgi:hypothetical protein